MRFDTHSFINFSLDIVELNGVIDNCPGLHVVLLKILPVNCNVGFITHGKHR